MEKTSNTQMTKQEKEQLFRALWSVADVLRGAMTADNFRDYMLSLLFYRYISELESIIPFKIRKVMLYRACAGRIDFAYQGDPHLLCVIAFKLKHGGVDTDGCYYLTVWFTQDILVQRLKLLSVFIL